MDTRQLTPISMLTHSQGKAIYGGALTGEYWVHMCALRRNSRNWLAFFFDGRKLQAVSEASAVWSGNGSGKSPCAILRLWECRRRPAVCVVVWGALIVCVCVCVYISLHSGVSHLLLSILCWNSNPLISFWIVPWCMFIKKKNLAVMVQYPTVKVFKTVTKGKQPFFHSQQL